MASLFDASSPEPLAASSAEAVVYTISQLARLLGLTPRAIRFYEDRKLIAPTRRGCTRLYSKRDYIRLQWILRGKRVGFSLADIGEMLDLYDLGDDRRQQRKITLAKCRQRIADLYAQQQDLRAVVADLEQFCTSLEQDIHNKKP